MAVIIKCPGHAFLRPDRGQTVCRTEILPEVFLDFLQENGYDVSV